MAESNSPSSSAAEPVATGRVVNLPIEKRRTRRPAKKPAATSGKVLQIGRANKQELADQHRRGDVRRKFLQLFDQIEAGQSRGLLFMVDMGEGEHACGFVGSYEHDPEAAYIPAAKMLHELSLLIHRQARDS